MSEAAPATSGSPARPTPGWAGRNRHFLVATGILLATSGWWLFAEGVLDWALQKKPVPWPDWVQVGEDFRLLNLPPKAGPYERVEEDGYLSGASRDGQPDGEVVLEPDVRELLGIGTKYDRSRFKDRCSNWYVARMYKDTRLADPRSAPYGLWRLDVTYYTGGLDRVPHVPDVCLVQGGARLLGARRLAFQAPAARSGWDQPIRINCTRYEGAQEGNLVPAAYSQYYLFCMNGRPEHDWKAVRMELAKPWVRYCYFAKIQFLPACPVGDAEEGDRQAKEFLRAVLPSVLEALPTRQDVEKLAQSGN